ncbi:MAG: YbaY family lipoprotein [Dokdonella sp.]|nr:YbaY family lipoprotein [Dokdonella sp.]
MRNLFAPALVGLLVLGGCKSGDQGGTPANGTSPTPASTAAQATSISGTVALRDQIPLGTDAKLTVRLVDLSQPEIAIAEKVQPIGGNPPFQFTIDFDPARIDPNHTYVIEAMLVDGDRRFMPALNSPVLTGGNGATAEVVLNAEATPGEKLKEEINKVRSNSGGMKRIEGSYLNDQVSVAWDAFVSEGHVRFARVITDRGEAGRSTVQYAFKDDRPLGVIAGSARIGWDESGAAILNEDGKGGQLDDAAVKAYQDEAVKALKMAQEKLPAPKRP